MDVKKIVNDFGRFLYAFCLCKYWRLYGNDVSIGGDVWGMGVPMNNRSVAAGGGRGLGGCTACKGAIWTIPSVLASSN